MKPHGQDKISLIFFTRRNFVKDIVVHCRRTFQLLSIRLLHDSFVSFFFFNKTTHQNNQVSIKLTITFLYKKKKQLVQWKGLEVDRHLLRCLFSSIDFSSGQPPEASSRDYFQVQLLKQECNNLLCKPSLISNLCFAVDHPFNQQKV